MIPRLRRATLLALGVATLTVAGCGVSSMDASSDTTTPVSPTTVAAPGGSDTTDASTRSSSVTPSPPASRQPA